MNKYVALAGVLVCAGGLVFAGKMLLGSRPTAGAASVAESSDGSRSDSSQADSKQEKSSASAQFVKKDEKKDEKSEAKKDDKDEGFRYPNDRGGKILSQMLASGASLTDEHCGKKSTAGPSSIEQPSLTTPTAVVSLPRLPVDPLKRNLLLGQIPEELPFSYYQGDPRQPVDKPLPTGDRIRTPSVDVNKPMPLVVLAKPVSDRASLDDPSVESSFEAVISAKMPTRTQPAPYILMTLPNPFEFRHAVQSKTTLDEDPMPITGTPRPPR